MAGGNGRTGRRVVVTAPRYANRAWRGTCYGGEEGGGRRQAEGTTGSRTSLSQVNVRHLRRAGKKAVGAYSVPAFVGVGGGYRQAKGKTNSNKGNGKKGTRTATRNR